MAIRFAQLNIGNINDQKGLNGIMTALKNIDGVIDIELLADAGTTGVAKVKYEDTQTSIHALTAAINMVDYVTQPIPNASPYS